MGRVWWFSERSYEREMGKRVFAVGPVSLCNWVVADAAEHGRGPVATAKAARILTWLDSKLAGSVIYVCFGSLLRFSVTHMREIKMGLEDSRVPFLWVIGEVAAAEEMEWRVGERGMVVRGWVPQVAALGHAAVGGFMMHCGWGAVVEAARVSALIWPLFAEQFYNEALVVGVVGMGATVGAAEGFVWGEEEKAGVVVGNMCRRSEMETQKLQQQGHGGFPRNPDLWIQNPKIGTLRLGWKFLNLPDALKHRISFDAFKKHRQKLSPLPFYQRCVKR